MSEPTSLRASACLNDVLITTDLVQRHSREPDYNAENRALVALADEIASRPDTVLQKLADIVLELCSADSAGVSVLETANGAELFRWHAAAGAFAPYLNGTIARSDSTCAVVIERNEVSLFRDAGRYFPALNAINPPVYETLLVPWHVRGHPVGTVWAVAHHSERRFDAEDARRLQSVSRFASAAHQIASALEDRKRSDNAVGQTRLELRELSRHLMTAQEDERRRIGRELHDDVGQRTALIEFAITELRDRLRVRGITELCGSIDAISADMNQLSECLRDISHRFHPSALVDLGLPAALKSLAEEQQRHGQDVVVSISDVVVDLPLATGLVLYRIAQEALRNAAKHACGAPVRVKLEVVGNELGLSIEDAGCGFDLKAVRNTGGLGIKSMKERAMLAGGDLLIRTAPGDGTSVYVHVPLEAG